MAFVLRKEWGVVTTHVQNPLGREGQGKKSTYTKRHLQGYPWNASTSLQRIGGENSKVFRGLSFQVLLRGKIVSGVGPSFRDTQPGPQPT